MMAVHGLFTIASGIITIWQGLIADIPSGWVLCDGTNGTPDLRDKFVVGAKQDDGGVAKTTITGGLTQLADVRTHSHSFAGLLPAGKMIANVTPDGDYLPQASGSTDQKFHIPPYYAKAYIMKK
jgi:hypothetical protein